MSFTESWTLSMVIHGSVTYCYAGMQFPCPVPISHLCLSRKPTGPTCQLRQTLLQTVMLGPPQVSISLFPSPPHRQSTITTRNIATALTLEEDAPPLPPVPVSVPMGQLQSLVPEPCGENTSPCSTAAVLVIFRQSTPQSFIRNCGIMASDGRLCYRS